MTIPEVTYSNNFGVVKKAIWYEVNDISGIYTVNLLVTTNQLNPTNIVIQNIVQSSTNEYQLTLPPSASVTTTNRTISLTHVPGLKGPQYVILNQGN